MRRLTGPLLFLFLISLARAQEDQVATDDRFEQGAQATTEVPQTNTAAKSWAVAFDAEISRNGEHLESIGQNAYALFALRPSYTFSSDWTLELSVSGRQLIKPEKVWRWRDTTLYAHSPKVPIGTSAFSVEFVPSITYPTSQFSLQELELRFGTGLRTSVTWRLSEAKAWTLQALEYSLGITRDFYRFKTDSAGEPVTEWIITHTFRGYLLLWPRVSLDARMSVDSEFHSSNKIFNSISLEANLNYRWSKYLMTYVGIENSGDTLRTQERLARLGSFGQKDTQAALGVSVEY